jgi:hypothetical protein
VYNEPACAPPVYASFMKMFRGLMGAVLNLDSTSSLHKQDRRPTDNVSEHYCGVFGPPQLQVALMYPVQVILACKADLLLLAAKSPNGYRKRVDIP